MSVHGHDERAAVNDVAPQAKVDRRRCAHHPAQEHAHTLAARRRVLGDDSCRAMLNKPPGYIPYSVDGRHPCKPVGHAADEITSDGAMGRDHLCKGAEEMVEDTAGIQTIETLVAQRDDRGITPCEKPAADGVGVCAAGSDAVKQHLYLGKELAARAVAQCRRDKSKELPVDIAFYLVHKPAGIANKELLTFIFLSQACQYVSKLRCHNIVFVFLSIDIRRGGGRPLLLFDGL